MDSGWIKLHRKITEWDWYQDSNTFRVFMHLLLTVNREPKTWRGIEVPAGGLITGRKKLAEALSVSEQNIRTALTHLEVTGELTSKPHHSCSLVVLKNWNEYQLANQPTSQQVTSNQPTSNQQVTTTKEVKKLKEVKNTKSSEKKARDQKKLKKLLNGKGQEYLDALGNFKEMRITKRAPMTTWAAVLLLRKLEKFAPGDDSAHIEMLEKSTASSWTDVYEPDAAPAGAETINIS